MINEMLSLVVICYDPYLDAIKFSTHYLNKNWPSIASNTLFVTSQINNVGEGYKTLITNGDLSFWKRLKIALDNVKTEYILLLLDDYLIDKRVNENNLIEILNYIKTNDISSCEIFSCGIKPAHKRINKNFSMFSDHARYRISLQPAIFSKKILYELVEMKPATPWDAEMCFMKEAFKKYDSYYCNLKTIHVLNYIYKGNASRKAYKRLKKDGLWHNDRAVISIYKTIMISLRLFVSSMTPSRIKNAIKGKSETFN